MAINKTFSDWSTSGLDWKAAPYNACSPNLIQVRKELDVRFGPGEFLGCHADREIRDGTSISAHAYGAAFDWRYPDGTQAAVIKWLIDNSAELHVQAIHDYRGCRIWRAGRTANLADAHTYWWKTQPVNPNNGMGQAWATYLHIETTPGGFGDTTPIADRFPGGWTMKPDHARLIDTRKTKRLEARGELTVNAGEGTTALVKVSAVNPAGRGWLSVDGGETTVVDFEAGSYVTAGTDYVALYDGHFVITAGPVACDVIVDRQGIG